MQKSKYNKVKLFSWVHKSRGSNVIFTYKFCKDRPGPDYRHPTYAELSYINNILMRRARLSAYSNRGIF